MFFCELKFLVDILKKWINDKFTRRYLELDLFTKQRFRRNNPVRWRETTCSLCDCDLAAGASNGPHEENITYFDFMVKNEHSFIRNIFDPNELSAHEEITTLENYFENSKMFIQIVLLLDNTYPEESDIEGVSDERIVNLVDENEIESFQHLYLKILNTEIKRVNFSRKTKAIF